jgi:hypothetical protein
MFLLHAIFTKFGLNGDSRRSGRSELAAANFPRQRSSRKLRPSIQAQNSYNLVQALKFGENRDYVEITLIP